jgi:hypothetical protein
MPHAHLSHITIACRDLTSRSQARLQSFPVSRERWAAAIQLVVHWGANAYVIWAAVVRLALPWLCTR